MVDSVLPARRLGPVTEGGVHLGHDLVMAGLRVLRIVTSTPPQPVPLTRRTVLLLLRMLRMLMMLLLRMLLMLVEVVRLDLELHAEAVLLPLCVVVIVLVWSGEGGLVGERDRSGRVRDEARVGAVSGLLEPGGLLLLDLLLECRHRGVDLVLLGLRPHTGRH